MTGREFRARRLALGYTTRDTIAPALGISPTTVQRYETTQAKIPTAIALAMKSVPAFKKG